MIRRGANLGGRSARPKRLSSAPKETVDIFVQGRFESMSRRCGAFEEFVLRTSAGDLRIPASSAALAQSHRASSIGRPSP